MKRKDYRLFIKELIKPPDLQKQKQSHEMTPGYATITRNQSRDPSTETTPKSPSKKWKEANRH